MANSGAPHSTLCVAACWLRQPALQYRTRAHSVQASIRKLGLKHWLHTNATPSAPGKATHAVGSSAITTSPALTTLAHASGQAVGHCNTKLQARHCAARAGMCASYLVATTPRPASVMWLRSNRSQPLMHGRAVAWSPLRAGGASSSCSHASTLADRREASAAAPSSRPWRRCASASHASATCTSPMAWRALALRNQALAYKGSTTALSDASSNAQRSAVQ